jgi:hypothetical protein
MTTREEARELLRAEILAATVRLMRYANSRSQPAKSMEYGSADHESVWKRSQARIDQPVTAMQRIAKREFQRQQNEVSAKVRAGKSFGRGLHKDSANPPPVGDVFDLEAEAQKFIDAFTDPVTGTVQMIGSQELAALGISGAFDITRPDVVKAIKGLLHTVSLKTNETTWNDLVSLFEEAEMNGEGIPAIMERLSAYFGDRKSDYQTERIARTTMTGASNAGTVEAWRQSEVVSGKTWISALQPGRTRDAHAEAHGQTVPLNGMYVVGGESLDYPGDPYGSPGNIINCLCSEIAVVEGAPID